MSINEPYHEKVTVSGYLILYSLPKDLYLNVIVN